MILTFFDFLNSKLLKKSDGFYTSQSLNKRILFFDVYSLVKWYQNFKLYILGDLKILHWNPIGKSSYVVLLYIVFKKLSFLHFLGLLNIQAYSYFLKSPN